MAKKRKVIIYCGLVVAAMSLLIFFRFSRFISITNRLISISNINSLKCFFEQDNSFFDTAVGDIKGQIFAFINAVKDYKSWPRHSQNFLTITIPKLLNIIILVLNIGINMLLLIFMYFQHQFSSEVEKAKCSLPARLYLYFITWLSFPICLAVKNLKRLKKLMKKNRRLIILTTLLLLLASSILYQVLVEFLIFIVVYIYRSLQQQAYLLLYSLVQFTFAKLYPLLKSLPLSLWIILILSLVFFKALGKANKRLLNNHQRLKKFAKDELTQTTFINGPPGTGKTLLNVSLSLAGEENYIEELEDKILDYEIKFPRMHFGKVRSEPNKYLEHQEYLNLQKMLRDRSSFIIANFSIFSPYFNDYCKIFDFNYMRKNIKTDIYPLEEYIIISISELDKEYNSHDDKQKVGADGAATFFSTTSHDLKRHVKIFCDYQLKDQVPLRIRGNSEYFYTIHKRDKKYPFLLYFYFKPIIWLTAATRKLIKSFHLTRPFINRKTKRKSVSKYKRNDINLLSLILKQLAFTLSKITAFFDHYWFYKLYGDLSMRDGAVGEEKNICINICDLSINKQNLYDSTFLSYAYQQKKNKDFRDLPKFTRLTPSIEELTKCNSQFYNKLNGLETASEEKEAVISERDQEEFITVDS